MLLTVEQVSPVVRPLLAMFNPTLSGAVVDDGGAEAMLLAPPTPRSRMLPVVSTCPAATCARAASTLSVAGPVVPLRGSTKPSLKLATTFGPAKHAAGPGWLMASPTVPAPPFV